MKTKVPTSRASTAVRKKRDASEIQTATECDRFDFKRILVPIDFSDDSKKALGHAAAFSRQFGARITLLHVVVPIPVSADYGYGPVTMQYQDETATRTIEEQLATLGRKEAGDRVSEVIVRCGAAFDEIARAAKELDIDLIVLSTHGYTGLKHILLGSTAERVVRHAPCPVLILRERVSVRE
jgi:universal stress protein A